MILYAVIKSSVDKAPYRVYINNELITERLYIQAPTNTLRVNLVDQNNYEVTVTGVTDATVELVSYKLEAESDALA